MFRYFQQVPVRIYPLFWLVIVAIAWLNSLSFMGTVVWTVVMFFSVLVHEYGHAFTARLFGQQARIELFGLGGMTLREGKSLKKWQEFLVVANGPLAGFSLFILAYLIYRHTGNQPGNLFLYAVEVMLFVNLFWTFVNLLPILPLDGGNLMRILMEALFGMRGIKLAFFFSFLLSAILCFFSFILSNFLMGAIFMLFAFEGFRSWNEMRRMSEEDRNEVTQNLFKEAEHEFQYGSSELAQKKLEGLRMATKQGKIYQSATEKLAELFFEEGRFKKAYDLLTPFQCSLSPELLSLLQQCAFQSKRWQEAIDYGKRAFIALPRYDTALINAMSHALLEQSEPAVGWLHTAIQEGLPNPSTVLSREEFKSISETSVFKDFKKNLHIEKGS